MYYVRTPATILSCSNGGPLNIFGICAASFGAWQIDGIHAQQFRYARAPAYSRDLASNLYKWSGGSCEGQQNRHWNTINQPAIINRIHVLSAHLPGLCCVQSGSNDAINSNQNCASECIEGVRSCSSS